MVQTPPRQATPERTASVNNLTNEPLAESVLALFDTPYTSSPTIITHTNVSTPLATGQSIDSGTSLSSVWIAVQSTPVAYPQIWNASSRGESIANTKKCPLCKRQNDKKECVGGPPCVACKRKGRTAEQCCSDEPPKKKEKKTKVEDRDKTGRAV